MYDSFNLIIRSSTIIKIVLTKSTIFLLPPIDLFCWIKTTKYNLLAYPFILKYGNYIKKSFSKAVKNDGKSLFFDFFFKK